MSDGNSREWLTLAGSIYLNRSNLSLCIWVESNRFHATLAMGSARKQQRQTLIANNIQNHIFIVDEIQRLV